MTSHRVAQFGPYFAATAALLGMLLFVLAGIYTFRQQNHVDAALCQSDVRGRAALRGSWEAARILLVPTADNPAALNAFFDGILKPIPPLECVDNQPVPKEE